MRAFRPGTQVCVRRGRPGQEGPESPAEPGMLCWAPGLVWGGPLSLCGLPGKPLSLPVVRPEGSHVAGSGTPHRLCK